jgi:hypothetical protein
VPSGSRVYGNLFPCFVDKFELDDAVDCREERIIAAFTDIITRMYFRTALPHDYRSAFYELTAEPFYAKTFRL